MNAAAGSRDLQLYDDFSDMCVALHVPERVDRLLERENPIYRGLERAVREPIEDVPCWRRRKLGLPQSDIGGESVMAGQATA